MAVTQEAILKTLLEGGGKVKNSDLLSRFKEPLNCSDPADKKQNRDLFKIFVNNIAVVKELEETKYVVLKKVYHHLLNTPKDETQREDFVKGELCAEEHKQVQSNFQDSEGKLNLSRAKLELSDDTILPSAIEIALEKSRKVELKSKRGLHFTMPLKSDSDGHETATKKVNTNKSFALPLRMPQENITPHRKTIEIVQQEKNPENSQYDKYDSGHLQFNKNLFSGSPQMRRHIKTTKHTEETKFSLDPTEHEWLVKCATGQWSQVYGLLLKDAHLADKRDFMSGFTALHWAVKYGNSEMVSTIIDVSRKNGHRLDVNTKSNGGYTPLHIAAIHKQLSIFELLIHTFGAKENIRDNNGKKPFYYLLKWVSGEHRENLGDPKAKKLFKEDIDPSKDAKTSIFTQNAQFVLKKKNKGWLNSMAEDGRGEPWTYKV